MFSKQLILGGLLIRTNFNKKNKILISKFDTQKPLSVIKLTVNKSKVKGFLKYLPKKIIKDIARF